MHTSQNEWTHTFFFFLTPKNPQEIKEIIMKTTQKTTSGINEIQCQIIKAFTDINKIPLIYIIN